MTVVGLLFLPRRDARLSSIGQLLLALVFYEWLGRILFNLASPFVLTAETTAVQELLSLFGDFTRDNLIIRAANGHGIRIETGCSAFHNLSFATLVWISLIKLETLEMKKISLVDSRRDGGRHHRVEHDSHRIHGSIAIGARLLA